MIGVKNNIKADLNLPANLDEIIKNISGLTADSRNIEQGYLFAAFSGSATDGRLFISQAIEAGATYILAQTGTILSQDDADKAILIEDDNPRLCFAMMASKFYPNRPEVISAVTGTSGKTSTANFTAQLWNALGHKAASLGTLGVLTPDGQSNANLTTMASEDLFRTLSDLDKKEIDHVVMEASSIGLEQYRLYGVEVASAAFTNLSRDHLDYHADMDDYFTCKMQLFTDLLKEGGTATICMDDEWGVRLFDMLATMEKAFEDTANEAVKNTLWTYGKNGEDIKLLSQTPHTNGQIIHARIFGQEVKIDLPLAGLFQGLNVLAAIGIVMGANRDLKLDELLPHVAKLKSVPGRMESIVGHPKNAGVIVDYAHKPGALEAVLKTLQPHVQGKLVCLFGCGGNRDSGKRPEMGAIAAKFSDHVIVTDDNPRHEDPSKIRADVMAGIPQGHSVQNIADRAVAIRSAVSTLEDGDVLVIAGKGHEVGQTIAGVTHPFDDCAQARDAIISLTEELK